jgi:hypothetical protein
VTEPVENTILGKVICGEAAADVADPELDRASGVEVEAYALEDERSAELLETPIEDPEMDGVALVI